jgi:hypothetical protein
MNRLTDYLRSERGSSTREVAIAASLFGVFSLMAMAGIEPSVRGFKLLLRMLVGAGPIHAPPTWFS